MATRSTIWYQEEDGSFKGAYCHWDGYLSNNGKILLENYNTLEKVKELLIKGSMSSLDGDVSKVKYYVDQGEDLQTMSALSIFIAKRDFEEYNYFFIDGKWKYSKGDSYTLYELIKDNA